MILPTCEKTGKAIAPVQSVIAPRPAGNWDANRERPRCPVHGFVMTEGHDIRTHGTGEIGVPNGTFSCYRCDVEREETR